MGRDAPKGKASMEENGFGKRFETDANAFFNTTL